MFVAFALPMGCLGLLDGLFSGAILADLRAGLKALRDWCLRMGWLKDYPGELDACRWCGHQAPPSAMRYDLRFWGQMECRDVAACKGRTIAALHRRAGLRLVKRASDRSVA